MGSYTKNGENSYLTNTLRGRYDTENGFFAEISLPFTYIEARQETATHIHEYSVMNFGDSSIRIGADLFPAWKGLFGGRPPPGASGPARASPASPTSPIHVILGLNLLCPTGKNTSSYRDPATLLEVYFPPEAQVGQGLWKPGVSLTAYRRHGRFYPLALASYTYGRMVGPSGYLLSDALTLGAGSLFLAWPESDLRFTGMVVGTFNVQDVRFRDPFSHRWMTLWDSHGWLFYFTLDASVRIWKGIAFECGFVVPLGKTVEESPNDMDFLAKCGARLRF